MSDEKLPESYDPEPDPEYMDKKLILKDIKPLDPFLLIDSFFQARPLWKSQHAIDSFNQFIYSKTNGIQYIIQRENPQRILKEEIDADKGLFKYEITLYYGCEIKSLHPDGSLKDYEDSEHIYISSPIEYSDGTRKLMWPNIARLKGYTYGSSVLCDIGIIFKKDSNWLLMILGNNGMDQRRN